MVHHGSLGDTSNVSFNNLMQGHDDNGTSIHDDFRQSNDECIESAWTNARIEGQKKNVRMYRGINLKHQVPAIDIRDCTSSSQLHYRISLPRPR